MIYVKAKQQREWMGEFITKEELTTCPKRKGPKSVNELTVPVNQKYSITSAASDEIRNHLVGLPNRPIFGYRA